MKDITIVFTKSKKKFAIGSLLIRLYTKKPYSHVARYKNILGEDMYYQASEGKVNYENSEVFDKKHEIVKSYTFQVSDEIERKIARACLHDAGKKYATMQNLGMLYVDFMRLFKKTVSNPWKDGRNCSELIYLQVLRYMFPELLHRPDKIKPHHIENILISKGYKPNKQV